MQIFAHCQLLNSPSPRVYYSIQVTTHAQKDVPSNNTYNIDSYPISSYSLNFHVRTVARFLSGLKRISTVPLNLHLVFAPAQCTWVIAEHCYHPIGAAWLTSLTAWD